MDRDRKIKRDANEPILKNLSILIKTNVSERIIFKNIIGS